MVSRRELNLQELKHKIKPKVQPLIWDTEKKILKVLDQRKLPHIVEYYEAKDEQDVYMCIREMYVRGAPAIGICAAYGMAMACIRRADKVTKLEEMLKELEKVAQYLVTARPTAVNLEWAVKRMYSTAKRLVETGEVRSVKELAERLEEEAVKIQEEEFEIELKIAIHGLEKLENCTAVMTQCNAGGLAGAGLGTALAPIKLAKYLGMDIKVYVPETRPWLQGARLTVYELHVEGIPYVLIADTAVGYVMYRHMIDAVIVGADRILKD